MRPLLYSSPELKTGGFQWVMNLADCDPYYALPIASTALQYAFMHYTDWLAAQRNAKRLAAAQAGPAAVAAASTAPAAADTPMRRLLEAFNYYRGSLTILLLPVVATLPAGLFVFQLTGLAYQFVQTAVLERGWVRQRLGLAREVRSIWKRREEASEEEVREFDRLQAAMAARGLSGEGAAVQEVPVQATTVSSAPIAPVKGQANAAPTPVFSSKSMAKRAAATKQQAKQR